MIKVNDRFSFEYDGRCWVLLETQTNFSQKKKKMVNTIRKSYHMSVIQVAENIIDRSMGEASQKGKSLKDCALRARYDVIRALYGNSLKREKFKVIDGGKDENKDSGD